MVNGLLGAWRGGAAVSHCDEQADLDAQPQEKQYGVFVQGMCHASGTVVKAPVAVAVHLVVSFLKTMGTATLVEEHWRCIGQAFVVPVNACVVQGRSSTHFTVNPSLMQIALHYQACPRSLAIAAEFIVLAARLSCC